MRDDGFESRPRGDGVNPRRLRRWQLRDIDRAANDARAAGDRAVKVHGVTRWLRYPEWRQQQAHKQCGQQRTSAAAGDGEDASPAMPARFSRRKQRSVAGGKIDVVCGVVLAGLGIDLRLLGRVCGRRLVTGSFVSPRNDPHGRPRPRAVRFSLSRPLLNTPRKNAGL